MARKELPDESSGLNRSRREWIESAVYLKAEGFEVAGALFHLQDHEQVSENEVKKRLVKYRGGEK
ncbi:hypothetical protein [Brevibacillus brevis]|uniref:Uncharacterized protein n=1 Tax=Brevibacillus brevis TaxID=1393 RepID=A0A517IAD2_BREBE|nr:hypothetical protein [Brevibacillus brevis]QDS35835.1 hypothetical protein FPS98_18450 [Brevibacillus brevis]